MRLDISLKNMERTPLLDNVIDKNIAKVERRLKIFSSEEAIHLSLHLEKNPHREEYFCWINMYLPFKVINVRSKFPSLTGVINDSFLALLKQMDKFKHRLETHLRKK
ncbi:MAG: HPF/RaiA family ribosome-associated protein [Candidatus Omnitrophica bacterium]|nr:HPF/RaiA family ribosome-associated protein [Candidatus Omnitrophota bacterium]MCM8826063.1 HPF/RaiA family ribosome-associated protein [Candidatus Omnitrophota bacterium]